MQLTPRYGGEPVLRLDPLLDDRSLDDPAIPMLRQRARLAGMLALLDDDQWEAPSRCEGWTVRDVIAHLVSTNQFWAFSITSGLQGSPTEFLADFDPVASPLDLVAASPWSPSETLDKFVETGDALAASLADLDEAAWSTVVESPPGHVDLRLLVLHALWDSWIHERDVVLPLGIEPLVEPDEVIGSLVYAAALSPAFLATTGSTREGVLEVRTTDPDLRFAVDVGTSVVIHDRPVGDDAVTIEGDAVDLLEGLSFRTPLQATVADEDRWLLAGLADAFDVVA